MAKVESFSLNHLKVKAPYVRIAGNEENADGAKIRKFDLRLIQPNQGAIPTAALHSLEHLLAVNIRDYLDGVIDISPMGCRTGFYLICWGQPSVREVRDALVKVLELALDAERVEATDARSCGNYRDHSLFGAKEYARDILKQGISLDPFERIFD
ncbi:S-ribosylhomocysteine lyase [Atopobacter sp. AH10]|uniref:S-ribosylhomocysteine lyase n=1 Tax=Atopobacter sp. AH10 TaxID=2315861 RepID=UPI000EF18A08|nr:S-ribosylhomocysteine lyase [Atopobacter sp. AH10]RLK64164.1 S-ribosylhomocysteine lyase [Atopobacter sp. AH10]